MFFKNKVGIDIVEVARFEKFACDRNHHFLRKTFTLHEVDYCFLNQDVAPHLAGIFAAKEAVSKALGVKNEPFIEIEIRHDRNGMPEAYKRGKRLSVSVSISHTSTIATAIASAYFLLR